MLKVFAIILPFFLSACGFGGIPGFDDGDPTRGGSEPSPSAESSPEPSPEPSDPDNGDNDEHDDDDDDDDGKMVDAP